MRTIINRCTAFVPILTASVPLLAAHSSDRKYLAKALFIVCLATIIRFTSLGANEFWLDESFTGLVATSSDWLDLIYRDNTPPVYYIVVRAWTGLFGSGEFAIRSLSALCGVGFVATSIATGRELFNRNAGLCAGLFAAVAPVAVYYSQEARNYSLLLLLIMAMVYLMVRVTKRGTRASWLSLIAVLVVLFHTHYFGVIVVASALLAWPISAAWQRDMTGLAALYGATLIAVLAFIPWLLWAFVLTPNTASELTWIETGWRFVPVVWKLPVSLQILALGPQPGQIPINLRGLSATAIPGAMYLGATLALAAAVLAAIVPTAAPVSVRRSRMLVLGLLLIPLLVLLGISLVWHPLYVIGRYDLLGFPALVLLTGYGLSQLAKSGGRLRLAGVIVLAMILLGAISLATWRYLEYKPQRPIESLAAKLDRWVGDRSGLILSGPVAARTAYYLHRQGIDRHGSVCRDTQGRRQFTCRFYPEELEQAPASIERYFTLNASDTPAKLSYLDSMLASIDTLWVVSASGSFKNGDIVLDRAEHQLFRAIDRAGFSIQRIDFTSNIVLFKRRITGAGQD